MKKFILLTWLFAVHSALFAQSQKDAIAAEIDKVMSEENIPAMSIAFIQGTNVTYINRGTYDRSDNTSISEKSVFQIGSLGKMLIAIVANNLIAESSIAIDDSIVDYLPANYSDKTKKKLKSITIEQLLHHRSGLPRDVKAGYKRKDGDSYLYEYTEEDFRDELEKVRLKKQGEFQYSNLGYGLLAYILEKASGQSFSTLLKKYVCEPYELSNTGLDFPTQDIVIPYRKDDRMKETKPWIMGKMAPPSAIYSTTEDLMQLMTHHLEAYVNNDSSSLILSDNVKSLSEKSTVGYGYGLFVGQSGMAGHGGDQDGYGSEYTFSMDGSYGIILLTSSGGKWIPPLIQKINNILRE